ncbi:MAG: DUF1566 domain-containing protein, partial [Treponema sp.]|nr:DUF1566 domain-containing protein [Treponema sp.]
LYSLADIKAAAPAVAGANAVGLSGLVAGTAYKAHVTVKDTAGNYSVVWSSEAFTPMFGGPGPAGGLIFYESTSGFSSNGVTCHYLEAAPTDLEGTYQWGGYGWYCNTGTAIGTGAANTAELATHDHGTPSSGSGLHLAARACADYSYGGYNDWFLPSIDELNLMYTNLKEQGLGGFSNNCDWSSSEYGALYPAWSQGFYYGIQYNNLGKDNGYSVRAVRAF